MRKQTSWPLVLILATLVHVDWHVGRPVHHRLSLGWSTHWLFAIAFFAAAGWYIARRWSSTPWKAAAWNVGIALLAGQVLEPALESLVYSGRFGYPVGQERWIVFAECAGAGLPALALVVWWVERNERRRVDGDRHSTAAERGGGVFGGS
jgi:hypothetical protein